MFKDLFNFGMKRSFSQALGFYVIYMLMWLVIVFVVANIYMKLFTSMGLDTVKSPEQVVAKAHELLPMVSPLINAISMIYFALMAVLVGRKKVLGAFGVGVVATLSGYVAAINPLLGMIPVVITTMMRPKGEEKEENDRQV